MAILMNSSALVIQISFWVSTFGTIQTKFNSFNKQTQGKHDSQQVSNGSERYVDYRYPLTWSSTNYCTTTLLAIKLLKIYFGNLTFVWSYLWDFLYYWLLIKHLFFSLPCRMEARFQNHEARPCWSLGLLFRFFYQWFY